MKTFIVKLATSNQEFEREYATILTDMELQLNLFLRNLDGSDKQLPPQNMRGAVYNANSGIELLFLNAYPFNLQLAALGHDAALATAYFARYIVENDIALRGVQGEWDVCSTFANEYEKLTGKKMRPCLSMDILRLTELKAVDVQGKLREANASDDFAVEGIAALLNERMDADSAAEIFNAMVADGSLFVYENENGTPTSIVQAKPFGSYATLNHVYTQPEYRNHGYAKVMIHELCKKLMDRYKGFVLFVNKNNVAANKLYAAVGFERVCENYDFRTIE